MADGVRPGTIPALVLLFVVAIVVGRLTVQGGWYWAWLLVAVPLLFGLLAGMFGVALAGLGTVATVGVALAFRAMLASGVGWLPLALLPLVVVAVAFAVRVVRALRKPDAHTGPRNG